MIYMSIGRRELGKTTLARYLLRLHAQRVYFDPRGMVPGDARTLHAFDLESIAVGFAALDEHAIDAVVVTPRRDLAACFDRVMVECQGWLEDGRSLGVLVDEIRFVDQSNQAFDWLLRCSDRSQVTIALTAHRPADFSPDIRAIADVWCLFQMVQEHDLKVLGERCSPAVVELVKTLRPFQFVAWDDMHGRAIPYLESAAWYLPPRRERGAPTSALAALRPAAGPLTQGQLIP